MRFRTVSLEFNSVIWNWFRMKLLSRLTFEFHYSLVAPSHSQFRLYISVSGCL